MGGELDPSRERMKSSAALEWTRHGGQAILDQALFAGGNFLLQWLLARWGTPHEYGAFAVAYSAFLFAAEFHDALVLQPAAVFGPSRHSDRLPAYLRAQLLAHILFVVPLGLSLVLLGALVEPPQVSRGLMAAGATSPLLLLAWTTRRALYIQQRLGAACLGSLAYLATIACGILLAKRHEIFDAPAAFVIAANASCVAAAVHLLAGRVGVRAGRARCGLRSVVAENWNYGRWQTATALLTALATRVQVIIAGVLLGLPTAGALQAMVVVLLPMTHFITAISSLMLPILSACFGKGDVTGLRRRVTLMTTVLFIPALIYWIAITVFQNGIEQVLYGGKYAEHAYLIPILGLIAIVNSLAAGRGKALLAIQRPISSLIMSAVGAPIGMGACAFLSLYWGVGGAAVSLVLAYLVVAVVAFLLYSRWMPQRTDQA